MSDSDRPYHHCSRMRAIIEAVREQPPGKVETTPAPPLELPDTKIFFMNSVKDLREARDTLVDPIYESMTRRY